ncbi:hypothetical protein OsI_18366 [Oryza sativa Indica Group]|uniref:DUF4371 domain-containing protein n=1 Tax=Oryza sativa subsp. indica TaxID=39946 RepID=B8AXX7_ORYSI|nr:hypothetical protein OsI_18366 [Oryza sativa Indica Group]
MAAVLPAASRRPARSGRSGLDLAVTAVLPGGSPARPVRGRRGAPLPPSLRPAGFAGGEAEGKEGKERGGRVIASRAAPGEDDVNFIMEKYLKRKVPDSSNNARTACPEVNDLNWKEEIKYDPGLRKPIDAYHPNLRDRIQSEAAKKAYFTRLNGSISVARRLLKQGLPFRGHDESKDSYNKGNFLEFRDMLEEHDHALGKAVGKYGAGNSLMTSSDIQKDIVECFAKEILHSIMEELGHDDSIRFPTNSTCELIIMSPKLN